MTRIGRWISTWKLASWRTALLVAFVLYIFIGFFGLPWIVERVMVSMARERLDRELTVEEVRCNPFALSLTVRGLSLPDRPGSTLLSFEELYANLQVSSLFRWALTLKEFRIDGLYAALRRFEDGTINVLELMEALESTSESDAEFELPRALLQLIEINAGRLDIEDRAREATALWTWDPIEVTLTEISTMPDQQGDNELTIGLATGGTIRTRGEVTVEPLGLDGGVEFDQFSLPNTWRLVEERFELAVTDGMAAGSFTYSAGLEDDGLHVELSDGRFEVMNFAVKAPQMEGDLVRAGSVSLEGLTVKWPDQILAADSLTIDSAYAHAWLEPDGTPSWDVLVPKATQEEIVEAYKYVEERVSLDARLGRFEVENASALFEDRRFDVPVELEVTDAGVVLTDVSTEPESSWGLTAGAALGEGSRAMAEGTLIALPLTLEADVQLEGLELSQFQRYVAAIAPVELRAGTLEARGKARLAPGDENGKITFSGELAVHGLDMDETVTGGKLVGWGDLTAEGIEAVLAPTSLDVQKADLYSAGLEVAVAEDGSVNLLEFFQALGQGDSARAAAAETREAGAGSGLPAAHIARLELLDCYGRYTDATTIEPFESRIGSVNGSISNISTETEAAADLAIDAVVDTGGVVHVSGEIDPFDYARLTDLGIDIRDVALPPMSPMSIKLIGFPIEDGSTHLDLSYKITQQKLVSTNHVEIDNLDLGQRVPGEARLKLPVKLGVSLLKDSNGRITLDIPIEGDLGNPDFVMVSAVQSAVTELVGEIAKAPFRLLGRLAGGSEDQDLERVEFAAGSAELDERAQSNLETLARALEQRPSLVLEIEAAVDPQADDEALREAALAAELGVAEGSFDELQSSHPIAELEALHGSVAGDAEVEALRAEHTSQPPESSLDEVAYRKALIEALIQDRASDPSAVAALGPARAEAIRASLVEAQGIEAARVTVFPDIAELESSGEWIPCKLAVAAGD